MGKGFQNFMSKKDFHPSAWHNLKKKWEVEQKALLKQRKEEELRVQRDNDDEYLNNKRLLGDRKAQLGIAFMYERPLIFEDKFQADEETAEPKFAWQRKYNAPREEWAKGNELIQDHPFGLLERNVQCMRCRNWGHSSADRVCPMFEMSGNVDEPGHSSNPSDLIREMRAEKSTATSAQQPPTNTMPKASDVPAEECGKEEGTPADPMADFVKHLSDKKKRKLLKEILGGGGDTSVGEKKEHKKRSDKIEKPKHRREGHDKSRHHKTRDRTAHRR